MNLVWHWCIEFDVLIAEVEQCLEVFRVQIKKDKNEIRETENRVVSLLNALYRKDYCIEESKTFSDDMRISIPNADVIDGLFPERSPRDFFFRRSEGGRRQQLAAERRAEYNAYLNKKEDELLSRRQIQEEKKSITPKSLLESIDYEKLVAKRKIEESQFRNLNYAEPSIDPSTVNPILHVKESPHTAPKENLSSFDFQDSTFDTRRKGQDSSSLDSFPQDVLHYTSSPLMQKSSVQFHHVTGGGGDPVKDMPGNLIATRGARSNISEMQGTFKDKRDSYRQELSKQIEENKRLKAIEEEKARLLEQQMAERIEKQRQRMIKEYEEEKKKNNILKEQRQQERLKNLVEFQQNDLLRNQNEKVKIVENTKGSEVHEKENRRSTSPPVPAIRSKDILKRVTSPLVTPPTQSLAQIKPENVLSSLADIRKTIMQDRQNFKHNPKVPYE